MSEQYEIGKWYRVPCVFGMMWRYARWWPVMGPKHEDAEHINFPDLHYHVDWRFVPSRWIRSPPSTALASPLSESKLGDVWYPRNLSLEKPEPRRAKCIRDMPAFPRTRATWLPRLERAYIGCKLKPGMVCPHRGIPLASLPAEGGVVTCPGHGLRWDIATGELIATTAAPASLQTA